MAEICSKCILPSDLPAITLDKDNKCNYCRAFEERYSDSNKQAIKQLRINFERLLNRYRGRGPYDCLVPVSGGKDSMYVLYVACKIYKLNVLAYNFDNGFQSPMAVKNIQRAVKKMGVDFISYKPKEDMLFDLYRIFLIRAGEFCSPCNMLIGAAGNRIARQNGIRILMNGLCNRYASGIDGISASRYCDRRYYFGVIEGIISPQKIEQYVTPSPILNGFRRLIGVNPIAVSVLNYLHPGATNLRETLIKEMDWEAPSDDYEHSDCQLNPLKDYLMFRKWGCTELRQAYSALVRNGEMTREEAMQKVEVEEIRKPPNALELFLEKARITHHDFEKCKNRHFTEYPNYKRSSFVNIGRKALSLLRPSL